MNSHLDVLRGLLAILLLLLSLSAPARGDVVEPLERGAPVPAIELDAILGPTDDRAAGDGAAVAMVIEFWGTWCHPCVEAIPHWNDLVDAFADRPVVFLSITDEDEETVRKFLGDRPIRGWVGIDRDRSTFDGFGVSGLPRTFLVDRNGRIAAVTRPDRLTETAIRGLLAGRVGREVHEPWHGLTVVERGEYRPDGGWPPTELTIAEAELGEPAWRVSPQMLVADGVDPRAALAIAWDLHPSQVILERGVPDRRLRLVVSERGAAEAELRRRLKGPLAGELGLVVREERRRLEVAVLRDRPGTTGRLRPAGSERPFVLFDSTFEAADDRPFSDLVSFLRELIDLPVVDETGLAGRWDWRIRWAEGREALETVVREQLGMDLAYEEREVPVLVVSPRS